MTQRRDVRDLGARGDGIADDTAAIQRALDGGDCIVTIPPGSYTVSAALQVASGTTIKAAPEAVIRLADNAGAHSRAFIITNADHAGGNTDISIEGGIWDGNCATNPRGEDGDMAGYTGTAINFINVRGLSIRDITVRDPESFSIRLGEVERFSVEDICFDHRITRPNQDGIHVGGFCRHGVIRNIRALTPRTTNDDMVALNADDDVERVLNLGMRRGPIGDITVEGLYAEDAYTFVRLLSVTEPIENITIAHIRGGCRFYAINMNNWRFPVGVGNIRGVRIRDLSVHKVHGSELAPHSPECPLIGIRLAVAALLIENVRREPHDDIPAPTLLIDNGLENAIHLEGAIGEVAGNGFIVAHGGFSLLTVASPAEA